MDYHSLFVLLSMIDTMISVTHQWSCRRHHTPSRRVASGFDVSHPSRRPCRRRPVHTIFQWYLSLMINSTEP